MSRKPLLWLLVITALALAVRVTGLGAQLPHDPEADTYIVRQALLLRQGGGALEARPGLAAAYPQLLARLLAAWMPIDPQADAEDAAASPEQRLAGHLQRASEPYRRGRLLIALLSTLVVPATFFLTRRFVGAGASLLAAGLVATSLLHIVGSGQARPHAALASFIALALLAMLAMRLHGRWGWCLLSGLGAAVAIGTLHSGVLLLPALVTAYLLRVRATGEGQRWGRLLLMLALPGLAVLWLYPLEADTVDNFTLRILQFFHGVSFDDAADYLWSADPVLTVLAGIGLLVGWRALRRATAANRRDVCVLAAFAVPYAISVGLFHDTQARYLLPLLPILALLAAATAGAIQARLARIVGGAPGWIIVAVLVLALPTWATARLARLRSDPDTLTLAAQWLERNVSPTGGLILVAPGLSLPLANSTQAMKIHTQMDVPWRTPWLRYQEQVPVHAEALPTWTLVHLRHSEKKGQSGQPRSVEAARATLDSWPDAWVLVRLDDPGRWGPILEAVRSTGAPLAQFPILGERDASGRVARGYGDRDLLARVLAGAPLGPPLAIHRHLAHADER